MAAKSGTTENEYDRLAYNELALYLSDELGTKDFNKLKGLFRRCPLSVKDLEEITDVPELFYQLEKYKKISVVNYEFFTERLRKVNPSLATYVEKKETEGLSPSKKRKTTEEKESSSSSGLYSLYPRESTSSASNMDAPDAAENVRKLKTDIHFGVSHCKRQSDLSFHRLPKNKDIKIGRDEDMDFKGTDSAAVHSKYFKTEELRKMKKAVRYMFALTLDSVARSPRKRTAPSDSNEGNTKKSSTSKSYAAEEHVTNPPSVEHDCSVEKPSQDKYIEERKTHIERLECFKVEKFGPQKFSANPDLINFYTGFTSYDFFCSVYNVIEPTASASNMIRWTQIQRNCNINTNTFRVELSYADQFFMFLCRIRQGFFEEDLAEQFCISQSTVIHIIITWSNYLYCILGCIPIRPKRAIVQNVLPECFKNTFPDTKVILDCTEIRVQTPSDKGLKSQVPNYKSHTTFKGLIGITPNGSVCFVSELYTGNISGKDITQRSGILDLLEAGDEVMIDRGFLIQDLLTPIGAKLVILPFLGSKGKLASLRRHVERAIRRCKEYRIFDQVVPMSIAGTVNQIWTVCCLLTNLQEKLF